MAEVWSAERIARGLTHRALGLAARRPGGDRFCIACGSTVAGFTPYRGGWRFAPPLMRELRYIAGDYDHCGCPRCGSLDRERHLLLYGAATGAFDGARGGQVVHFAPEPLISAPIEALKPARYVRCDLYPSAPHIERIDLTDLPFADDSIDLLIANHVIEHVGDADVALRAIVRVLKPSGKAILQTPFCLGLSKTWEDPAIREESARLQAYGQEDHVRLFGTDIFDRFDANGLQYIGGTHAELLPTVDASVNGVDPNEPFMLFRCAD